MQISIPEKMQISIPESA